MCRVNGRDIFAVNGLGNSTGSRNATNFRIVPSLSEERTLSSLSRCPEPYGSGIWDKPFHAPSRYSHRRLNLTPAPSWLYGRFMRVTDAKISLALFCPLPANSRPKAS